MSSSFSIGSLSGDTNGTLTGIDYTSELDRIATALETLATNSTAIAASLSTIATKQTTISDKTSDIRDYQFAFKNWAEHDGIHVKSPWEYVFMYTLIEYYQDKGIDFANAKAIVESYTKHRD